MTARTDIHSPTNFEPADYSYVGSFDNWPEPGAFLSNGPAQDFDTDFGRVEDAFTWEHAQYLGGRRLLREHMERQRNGGKTDAELAREAERAAAPDCPEGRYEITGLVMKVAEHESGFGVDWKMTVKDDRGFVVWMTVPSNLSAEKGDRVAVTATVTRSDRDAKFGFGKRPSKARLLESAPRPAEEVAA